MRIRGGQRRFDKFNTIPQSLIRLAEIFDEKTENAVTKKVQADKETLEWLAVTEEPDYRPEDYPFKKHFIKL